MLQFPNQSSATTNATDALLREVCGGLTKGEEMDSFFEQAQIRQASIDIMLDDFDVTDGGDPVLSARLAAQPAAYA
ncbi:MAG: hypothetical protein HRU31_17125 [Rhodobacteraceae bacterium]|nr:hypothetical protein [Paracoccaceae bacterium]